MRDYSEISNLKHAQLASNDFEIKRCVPNRPQFFNGPHYRLLQKNLFEIIPMWSSVLHLTMTIPWQCLIFDAYYSKTVTGLITYVNKQPK
jgi:hypothetical protein